ncbi:zinc finger, CCHC-type containing protein [Tanacetum coccineum]|uniref:Zinc finger, CCHC-type containing protein n=1 Tax=Tanacetum coccineum TaxID=301880 RepID=A0ABQ4ZDI2_9ASTR
MAAAAMKYMASNFAKLDKFEGVDFRRWQKKIHFLLSSMSVVYVLTTPIPEDGKNATMEQIRKMNKWDNDDYDSLEAKYMVEDASSKKFLISNFTSYKMTNSRPVMEQYNESLDFKHTLKHQKDELTLVELGNHMCIEKSLRVQDNDKPKGNNVDGSLVVNMIEHNNSFRCNDNKGKRKHQDTKVDPNKKSKVTYCKCGKPGYLKKDYKGGKVGNKANGIGINGSVDGSTNSLKGQNMFNKSSQVYYVKYVFELYFMQDDDVAWWVDSGATVHVRKDRCWFKTYESLNDGSILYIGNELTALVHGHGCVDLRFSSKKIVSLFNVLYVPNIRKNLVSSSILNNCGYKQVIESNKFVVSKHGVFIGFGYLSNQMFMLNIVNDNIGSAFFVSRLNDSILWHARLGHVHFKRMQDMSKDGLIPAFDMDTEKCYVVVPWLGDGVPGFQEHTLVLKGSVATEHSDLQPSDNIYKPLLQDLSRVADSHDIRDQFLVLFRREVAEDSYKIHNYRRLSSKLREGVRMRDGYINELQMSDSFDEVPESIEIMRRMQVDDMEKASHFLLMAREV